MSEYSVTRSHLWCQRSQTSELPDPTAKMVSWTRSGTRFGLWPSLHTVHSLIPRWRHFPALFSSNSTLFIEGLELMFLFLIFCHVK